MSNVVKLCVPSYKRAGAVKVFESIPLSHKDHTFLYVREHEYEDYSELYGHRCNVVPLANVTNIGETRQKIVEHQYGNRILMLDDDVGLHKVKITSKGVIQQASGKVSEAEFYKLADYLGEVMDAGFVHGGFNIPIFPRHAENAYPYRVNSFFYAGAFFDLSKIPIELLAFKDWIVFEDVYVYLNLVTNGFDAAKIYKWVLSQPDAAEGSRRKFGGCWETRTAPVVDDVKARLLELFPEHIRETTQRKPLVYADGEYKREKTFMISIQKATHARLMREKLGSYTQLEVHRPEAPTADMIMPPSTRERKKLAVASSVQVENTPSLAAPSVATQKESVLGSFVRFFSSLSKKQKDNRSRLSF